MTTTSGTPIEWRSGCLQFQLNDLPNPDFSTERLHAALDVASHGWTSAAESCPNKYHVDLLPGLVPDNTVTPNGKNFIIWRLKGFCDGPDHKDDEICLAPNVAASTTVFFRDKPGAPDDGEILKAVMEINAVNFSFDDQASPDRIDLPSVLAHELGHASGLDHTCTTLSGGVAPVDANGQPVPSCFPLGALPAADRKATMFNFIDPGDTSKRAPGADEQAAICGIYSSYAGTCRSPTSGGCGCRVGAPDHAAWIFGGAAALLALASLRRRARGIGSR